jgi:Flp pilus assembly protein TadG
MSGAMSKAERLRRLASDSNGSAAVEFALILPLFLLVTMAAIQIPWILFTSQHLENATATMGRLIRTGQAQGQKLDQVTFRMALCEELAPVLKCDPENLMIDVQTLPDFGVTPLEWPVDDDGRFKNAGVYQLGTGGEIVVLRTFYQLPVWLPMVGSTFANIGSQRRLLASSAAFRNEPF